MGCALCPRECGAERDHKTGYCREGSDARVAKIMLHHWEEPCISGGDGAAGSGAIFFSGCSLMCVYCQNRAISRGGTGEIMTPRRLADEILRLRDLGALNVNLVTPTHFTDRIKEALDLVKGELDIPVVWNTSGYEKPQTVTSLKDYVDVFLTDFKYVSDALSEKYSHAADYARFAKESLCEMVRITGAPVLEDGLLKRGTVVRHLVLPGCSRDSLEVLREVDRTVGAKNVILSLMSQYTPSFLEEGYDELSRVITTFEYERVVDEATHLGFEGYMQSRSSATPDFTPDFEKDTK